MSKNVTFTNAGVVLAGSLTVPDRGAPVPGVVMVGGSGPSDRDNDTHFPPIRRHLVDAGIAVLSYDKRGVGGSSSDWLDATVDDLATDAAAALDFLRAQPGVRGGAVGLFGHSEGGWVVLRATALRADVPWVITNSGPGMTPAAQDRYALANLLRKSEGITDDEVDAALAAYDRITEAGRRDAPFAEAARIAQSPPTAFSEHAAEVDERYWNFLKRKQDHDPIPDASRLHCPHLAIFGTDDELVPVADSIHHFAAAAHHPDRGSRATLTVEVFPGADHRVRTGGGTRLAPGYLDTLARWITGRTADQAT
ncbi:alpha/beta hydrolase family protein [Saccharothrix obliqua]|uniref:alpha/beta hydrolase family protein n=1 Tax=Saccharothrix obliqua TaxID=2861747 RepID=UPI001C5E1384|nr:alpha/beta hydrolase [Saccharothrix obliqua]MBW4720525.1 alpha/beta hydrolase [Saccharothrix obliqua]